MLGRAAASLAGLASTSATATQGALRAAAPAAARAYHENVRCRIALPSPPPRAPRRPLRPLHQPQLTPPSSHDAQVVDHYERPRNVGAFDKDDPSVGTGLVGAPACGDVMKLQIRVDAAGNIVDSCFKTFGCGSAIASSSVATEWVKGRAVDDVLTIRNSDIAKHLSLPPVKLHCSMLAEDAIKAAVKDWKAKRAAAGGDAPAKMRAASATA